MNKAFLALATLSLFFDAGESLRAPSLFSDGWVREAEKKHGRAAMLALPTLVALSAADPSADPVKWLNSQPVDFQLEAYSLAAVLESFNLRRLGKGFSLKEGVEPGRVWDSGKTIPPLLSLSEDIVGRFAMLACFLFLFRSAVLALS
jgi:hypothetical protein